MRKAAQTEQGRLLRILFIRNREVPAGASVGQLLWSVRAMTPPHMTIGDAVRSLRALSQRPIDNAEALSAWQREADDLWKALKESGDLLERMPHFISHYLSDAHLRCKDAEYRQIQDEQLVEALESLEALAKAGDV